MKQLLVLLLSFTLLLNLSAMEPEIEIKDIRIDDKLINPQVGRIDTTSGTILANWTAVILDLDITIPEGMISNKFETGKWLNSITIDWQFMYKPSKFDEHINNYMRFTRSVTYKHIPEGENKVAIFIEPAVMQRYFQNSFDFKRNLLSKINIETNGNILLTKTFRGEREEDISYKAFNSMKSYPLKKILKSRLETPFRSVQTAEFLSISRK